MFKNSFSPDSYIAIYKKGIVKKSFSEFNLIYSERNLIPEVVRIEPNRNFNNVQNASDFFRIRNSPNWKKCSFTGLRPIGGIGNYFYGDLQVNYKKSLLLFYISDTLIITAIFKEFYPTNPSYIKNQYLKSFIDRLHTGDIQNIISEEKKKGGQ